MDLDRIKLLQEYARQDPDDPFPPYALALELLKTDPIKSRDLFEQVLINHPTYLPTYYHAGHYYLQSGDSEKARRILEAGIQLAASTGNRKTGAELKSLLDEID